MMIILNLLLCCIISSQEIDRRIAIDFNKQLCDILPYIQMYYPNADSAQIARWEDSKALEFQIINGEKWYFRNAGENLFRIDKNARNLKTSLEGKEKAGRDSVVKYMVKDILNTADTENRDGLFLPTNWRFQFKISIPNNYSLIDGKKIRAWLPAPNKQVRRQTNVNLVYSNIPALTHFYTTHANIFLQQKYDASSTCSFESIYTFTSYAEYHRLPNNFQHNPIDKKRKDLKPYLKERIPHCVFTDKVKALADSIVGEEIRPYFQARKLFEAMRALYPWASAREYSTIENIPDYVIEHRHGDCGQVSLLYIAMCRYKGIPARWQSGFMLHPGYENLHDWCEIYIEGLGWIPVDPSFGVQEWGETEEERYFYFGGIDACRLIVNTDWGKELVPNKKFERSETVDFQRGECECPIRNLYFNEWKYDYNVNIIKQIGCCLYE